MIKKKRILIMGLPGSGKSFLARRVVKFLRAEWLNADKIRRKYNDWDFSKDGIIRQVTRMKHLSDKSRKRIIVADFICPLPEQRKIFKPHCLIWMDTIKKSRYPRINRIFKKPKNYDLRIKDKEIKLNLIKVKKILKLKILRSKKP